VSPASALNYSLTRFRKTLRCFVSGSATADSVVIKRLDFAMKKSNNLPIVKQRSRNFVAIGLAALFALAVLCSTFAAPSQSLASTSGCSQAAGPMAMVGCENPGYLCDFDLASKLISHGALSSARSNDSVKNTLGLAVGAPAIDISRELAPPETRARTYAAFASSAKAPIRLFHSVFIL